MPTVREGSLVLQAHRQPAVHVQLYPGADPTDGACHGHGHPEAVRIIGGARETRLGALAILALERGARSSRSSRPQVARGRPRV